MLLTPNLKLKKPELNDYVNIADFNDNADAIDASIKSNQHSISTLETQVSDTPKLGSNSTVNKIKALEFKMDTRVTKLVYTSGNLTQVLEKDDASTVRTTTLNYDGSGNLNSVEENAGGTTVITTLNYASGNLSSVSKVVI